MHTLTQYFSSSVILSWIAILIVPVAALQPLWISIIAAIAATSAALGQACRRQWLSVPRQLIWLLAALIMWGAASTIWSVSPDRTVLLTLRLMLVGTGTAFLVSTALNLDRSERKILECFLIAGVASGLLFVLFELATGGLVHGTLNGFEKDPVKNLFELNRASSVISIIAWVAIIPTKSRFGWVGVAVLLLLSGFVVTQLQPGSPILAFITGAGVFVLAWFLPRLTIGILSSSFTACLILIPFITNLAPSITNQASHFGISGFSFLHRLAIWDFSSERLLAHPIIGWGLGTSRSLGAEDLVQVSDAPELLARAVEALPLHPHSALLQAWLELGIVGALLLATLFLFPLISTSRYLKGRFERSAVLAIVAATFINAQLSFGIWQGWWLTCIALIAVLTTALVSPLKNS
jgi:exopolysaccharide production protein ExoQ